MIYPDNHLWSTQSDKKQDCLDGSAHFKQAGRLLSTVALLLLAQFSALMGADGLLAIWL